MYGIDLFIVGASITVVVVTVMIHYEASALLTRIMDRRSHMAQRPRILLLIFGLLAAHLVEICFFALGAWTMIALPGAGNLHWVGTVNHAGVTFFDFLYLSLVTYTTLGYGDLVPDGPISFLYGLESLTGFVLITWSASLTFIEMQKHWKPSKR